MLCLVLLSVSVAFAADDVTDDVIAIDDEITVDEPLAIEEDISIVSANESTSAEVVTKDTFSNYFDENGTLLSTVTADEIKFSGDIADVGVDKIVLNRTIKVSGDNAVLNNIAVDVKADDVVISGLTINQNNGTAAISVNDASNVKIEDTKINFNSVFDADGYAIYAELADNLNLINNAITYVGSTNGTGINMGILVSNSNNVVIKGNKFNLSLVSAYVPWPEIPEGSYNYVRSPVSDGVVVKDSSDVEFDGNEVTATFNSVSGYYDTIYSVDFDGVNNAVISNNVINGIGNTYIYGIIIAGEDFTIKANNITTSADYYANGIDVEGVATGIIDGNIIDVNSNTSVYAIYSGMNGKEVKANYTNNVIKGEAYNVFGFSSGDVESNIVDNTLDLKGNYTTGIAYRGNKVSIVGNNIVLSSSEEGNESIWESFGVEAVGIKVVKGNATIDNNTIATSGKGISITGDGVNAELINNFINVVANDDKDAYSIYADGLSDLEISGNVIDYQGTTQGTGVNFAVYLYNVTGANIADNDFILELVSAYVPWPEIPEGSYNYVRSPVSDGVVVKDSSNVVFDGNNVNVTYGDVSGYYDTIYSVDFDGVNNAVISNNVINGIGNTYIYGIIIAGEDFTIKANNITTSSNYYANGIDVEGVSSGIVENNVISAKGVQLSYPIYSGMNYKDVTAQYINNKLSGEAYFVLGMSLGDISSVVKGNVIDNKGNYTTGIGAQKDIEISGNTINAQGTNVGNESIWESFGVETVGVKIVGGVATIKDNKVTTTGDNSVKLADTASSVTDNILNANKLYGDKSVNGSANATVKNNYPVTSKLSFTKSKTVLLTAIKSGSYFKIVLKDSNGKVVAGRKVAITFNGNKVTKTTDKNGAINYKLAATSTGSKKLTMKFAGDEKYLAASGTATIKITKEATKLTAKAKTFKAKTKTKKYTVTLKDSKKKAIKKVQVTIKIGKKTFKATTNAKGQATFKITKLTKKAKYTAKVKFAGNKYYKAVTKSVKITVKK